MSDQNRNLILGQLKELGDLKEGGILSESEFQIEKKKLLDLLNNVNADGSSHEYVEPDDELVSSEESNDSGLSKDSSMAKSIAKGGARTVGALYTFGMSEVVIRSRKKRKAAEAELEDLKKQIGNNSENSDTDK